MALFVVLFLVSISHESEYGITDSAVTNSFQSYNQSLGQQNLSEKPNRVNIQIDVENDSSQSNIYRLLDEIESYNFRTTVFVTREFAERFPDIVGDIRRRGHEIALHGSWENNLSYNEQIQLLNQSVAVLRNASMQNIIHYRPSNYTMSYERDNLTLRAIHAAGLQTITAYITVNSTFPCCYSSSLGRIGRTMHLPEGIIAVPISVFDNVVSNMTLVDDEFSSPDTFLDYLMKKYSESSETKEPMIIVVHASNSKNIRMLATFLKNITETRGLVMRTGEIMNIANPYISGLSAKAPDHACKYEKIQVNVTYTANVWCPTYYFRVYGYYKAKYGSLKLLGSYSAFVNRGPNKFDLEVTIPKQFFFDDNVYTIRVVGRACRGGFWCWPTFDDYEAMTEIKVNVNRMCLLFVPLRWENTQAVFNNRVDTQSNLFVNEVPLKDCRDLVRVKKLDVASQNFANFDCNNADGGIASLKRFARRLQGINIKSYDVVVGVAERSPCEPIVGISNGVDTIWVTTEYNSVTAHELGHIFGLEDQYCSNPAGSRDRRCNDGGVGGIWNLWGLLGWDLNPLKDNLPYDCPPNGVTKDSTGKLCCNNADLENCRDVNYGVCCYGNKNAGGGRSTMSYADAPEPRGFDNNEKIKLADEPKLKCGFARAKQSTQMAVFSEVEYPNETESSWVIDSDLVVYRNDSVAEENFTIAGGVPDYYKMPGLDYNLTVVGETGNIYWNQTFDIYFDYSGPVAFGRNYSNISYDYFLLSFRIPYDFRMKELRLYHNNMVIFSKNLSFPFGAVRGKVFAANNVPVVNAQMNIQGAAYGSTVTDANGEFQFVGLDEGNYEVFVTPQPLGNLLGGHKSTHVYIGNVSTVDFTLVSAGSIAGLVTNESGVPVTDVVVYTEGYETPRYAPNESGFYAIPELSEGIYNVYIDASETYYSDDYAEINVTIGKTSWLNFTLRRGGFGAIEGIVSAANGTPVYGAYIAINGPESRSMYTGADGAYIFTRLKNGTYDVYVSPPYDSELSTNLTQVDVTAFVTTLLNITLPRGGAISGFVFSYNGTPVCNAYVYASGPSYGSVYTDESGWFEIQRLATGEYSIYAEPPYDSEMTIIYASINVTVSEVSCMNITLPKGGVITGTVLAYNGTPVYDASVYASGPYPGSGYTDIDGRYKIRGLKAGEYAVQVIPPYQAHLMQNSTLVNVTLGETVVINFVLSRATTLSNRYRDRGVDTNTNGWYDYLMVDVGVNATTDGYYTVSGHLYDNFSNSMFASNTTYLDMGEHFVSLYFDGLQLHKNDVDGPYSLGYVLLENSYYGTLDYGYDAYSTAAYNHTEFEKPPGEFTNKYSVHGLDSNNNTLLDYLVIDAGVDVLKPGYYYLRALLTDGYNTIETTKYVYLGSGEHTVSLNFSGVWFYKNGRNGQYYLNHIEFYDRDWILLDDDYNVYATNFYNFTSFERPSARLDDTYIEHGLDTDSDGFYDYLSINFGINVSRAGYFAVCGELYDDRIYYATTQACGYSFLNKGDQKITLNFFGPDIFFNSYSGVFYVKNVHLYDKDSVVTDYVYDAYTASSYNYTQFEGTATCGARPIERCSVFKDTTFSHGKYYMYDGVEIANDSVTLDCNGASLVGAGIGLYKTGIYSYFKNNIQVKNCNITSFGSAIYLRGVQNSAIKSNNMLYNYQALFISDADGNMVEKNNMIGNMYGVYASGIGFSNITKNNIFNNSFYNLYNYQLEDVTAKNNHWGADNLTTIAGNIYDHYDDEYMGIVDFEPWLPAPVITSVVGDVNYDCMVNIFDLAKVGICFSKYTDSCMVADLNADGAINIFDLATVGINFGKTC